MNLRYIALHMDYDSGYKDPFRDSFNLNSRFISNYVSVQIRKFKIPTDGSYNMISVVPSVNINHACKIVGDKALQARIAFDKPKYEYASEFEKYEYYLQLLREGYTVCAQHKDDIPLEVLLGIHQQFRDNNYKNEWLHKTKKFKKLNIEVFLNCFFSSLDFKLLITVRDTKSQKELISGTLVKTLPDEVCFERLFNDIIIEENDLIITEYQNRPKFKFYLPDVFKGKFSFEILNVGLEYKPLE